MRCRVPAPFLLILLCAAGGLASRAVPAGAAVLSTIDRWSPLAGTPPAARSGASWILDGSRNRMILFGGQTSGQTYLADVWTFDLGTRTWDVLPTTGGDVLLKRYRHTAIYDAANDRMIVYGGLTPLGFSNDVWSLNFATNAWTRYATSGHLPAARARHNAVYDGKRQRMVVFGGLEGDVASDSLYALDLTSLAWSHIVPVGELPEPRQSAALIIQPDKDRLMLFGGNGQYDGALRDVWIYSMANNTWAQITPSGFGPSPRFDVTASYDSVNNSLVVFGGSSTTASYADAFTLSIATPQTWSVLRPAGTTPFPRGAYAAPPVTVGGRYFLFGGLDVGGTLYNDTWALDVETPAYEALPDSGQGPNLRMACMAINDTAQSRMVFFGGWTGVGDFFNDSYELRFGPVGAPALTWAPLTTVGNTPPRYGAGDIYDPVNERFIVMCGGLSSTPFSNDVWALDLKTLAWSQLATFGPVPALRTGPACVYDATHHRIVMFGGLTTGNVKLDDTWVLDLASLTWSQVASGPDVLKPQGRLRMAHVDDPERNRMLISCGISDYYSPGDPRNIMFNDTWALDYNTFQWSVVPTVGDPPPRFDLHGEVIDDQERMVMFGGAVAGVNGDSNDLYSLDLQTNVWSLEVPQGTPPGPRNGYTMVWDKARRWLIPFGGTNGDQLLNDGGILYQTPYMPPQTPVDPANRPPLLPPGGEGVALALRARAAGGADFALRAPHDGPGLLEIFRADGRRIWSTSVHLAAGRPATVRWDGRVPSGERAAAGIYLVRLATPDGSARATGVLLH